MVKSPLSPKDEVANSANAAQIGFENWRYNPSPDQIQYLFRLENKLEENIDEFTRTITLEYGKTLRESEGQMRRAIENVELACSIPTMRQGGFLDNIASGIDEYMVRQLSGWKRAFLGHFMVRQVRLLSSLQKQKLS